jgi:hypothetical protein
MFMHEGRQIHRSSHALVDDQADVWSDANSAKSLFQALKDEDCVVFAHIGGRYADIKVAHDARIERSVEVHSDWGTFEWLIQDALEQGYRIGILANSDGHKGRHGASHPGARCSALRWALACSPASCPLPGCSTPAAAPSLRHHGLPHGARDARHLDNGQAHGDVPPGAASPTPGGGVMATSARFRQDSS